MVVFVSAGVGKNLQDHLELYVQQQCTQPITLYKAQKPFQMLKIGIEWMLQQTGNFNVLLSAWSCDFGYRLERSCQQQQSCS